MTATAREACRTTGASPSASLYPPRREANRDGPCGTAPALASYRLTSRISEVTANRRYASCCTSPGIALLSVGYETPPGRPRRRFLV